MYSHIQIYILLQILHYKNWLE